MYDFYHVRTKTHHLNAPSQNTGFPQIFGSNFGGIFQHFVAGNDNQPAIFLSVWRVVLKDLQNFQVTLPVKACIEKLTLA